MTIAAVDVACGFGLDVQQEVRQILSRFHTSLTELGLEIFHRPSRGFSCATVPCATTGKRHLPLIYPCHFNGGYVKWQKT